MSVKTNNEAIITGEASKATLDHALLADMAKQLVILRRHEDGIRAARERLIDITTALLK